jgi:dTDP-4-amino-4,6-dideoxygalactose transaminase
MNAFTQHAAALAAAADVVPQADPRAGYLEQRDRIDAAIGAVLAGGAYVLGEEVEAFEREFAAYVGVAHGVGVANGTDALSLALRGLGVGPGDRVATVSHTAVATAAAIAAIGAVPVLVDVDAARGTMDPAHLEATLAATRVAAVVVVHLYGQPADLGAIVPIVRAHGAALVEDCAQAHGATLDGRRVGRFGDAAAFSFYPTKNLGSFGDGGMVTTDDAALAERVAGLRQYGWGRERISATPGVNSRLHALQAAILRVRLRELDVDNARRARIAARYLEAFAGLPIGLPPRIGGCGHAWHQFVVRSADRAALRAALDAEGVRTAIHYPVPVHRQAAFADAATGPGGLPRTEQLADTVFSLPMFPQLPGASVERVVAAMRRALDQPR